MGLFDFSKRKRLEALWTLTRTMGGGDPGPVPRQLPAEASMLELLRGQIVGSSNQVKDSLRLIDTTANPDAFYPRVDFARQRLDYLCRVKGYDGSLLPFDPHKILSDLNALIPRREAAMWQRAYARVVEAARVRKTRPAQLRQFEHFFASAEHYSYRLGPQAAETIARCRSDMQALMS